MTSTLDLTKFIETSLAVPDRTAKDVFFHLAEEVGEVATCLHRPEKADELLAGELADVINCTLDIYTREYGTDFTLLQEQLDKKCAKWIKGATK